jgi:hypothetical protein
VRGHHQHLDDLPAGSSGGHSYRLTALRTPGLGNVPQDEVTSAAAGLAIQALLPVVPPREESVHRHACELEHDDQREAQAKQELIAGRVRPWYEVVKR